MSDIQEIKKHFPHQGKQPRFDKSVYIAEGARVVGDVEIGPESSIWHNAVVRADVCYVRIGSRTNIQDCSVIHETYPKNPCIIGDDVTVGHAVVLHGCKVGNGSLIGMGTIVLDNAEIGEMVLVGAGSLVTQGTKIPSGMLAFGRPAKAVRPLTEEEKEKLRFSPNHYVRLSRLYL